MSDFTPDLPFLFHPLFWGYLPQLPEQIDQAEDNDGQGNMATA